MLLDSDLLPGLSEPKVHALVDLLMQAPYLWTLLGSCQGTADFDKAIFGLVDVRRLCIAPR